MKYYKQIELDEHLLYSKEIAEILGVVSKHSGKPHSRMIKSILEKIRIQKNEEQIFFHSRKGMAQVYNKTYIYDVMLYMSNNTTFVDDIGCYHISIGIDNFYFLVKEGENHVLFR